MNVVSIDFDIIMEPDINLYNDWIEGDLGVNDFIKEHKLLENLKANLSIYEYLTRFLIQAIKQIDAKKVYFINSHDTIVKYIDDKSINLWNIDHHHDIAYTDENVALPVVNCNCGDWVKFLFDGRMIKEYTWIGNPNSLEPNEEVQKYYKYKHKMLQEFNLEKLVGNIDVLFICKSPEWLPEHYEPLFNAWIAICEEYYEEPFKII